MSGGIMNRLSRLGGLGIAGAVIAAATALTLTATQAPALARTAAASSSAVTSTPKCAASDLGVWVAADQGDGAAGTVFFPMEFTNLSGHACSLSGFPGVSATDSHGHQLGAPARWDHSVPPHLVTLAPGATAHSVLAYSDVVVSNCQAGHARTASALRIFPPDQFQAAHAYWDLTTCAVKGSVFMRVGAIQPGAGARA
jgi:uncharacterized protein DUF4232